MHLHDFARNESNKEFVNGGENEDGYGSNTVLIYPDDEPSNDTATEEPPPPVEKFKGSGRKL